MAATSNIFYNLGAWAANQTWLLGQTRLSSGNAYRCTQGGLGSTVAPSGTGSSITDGAAIWKYLASFDFGDLQTWWNSLPTTLTQPVTALLWNTGVSITPGSGAPVLTATGVTTSASNNITITCAPGESFNDYLAANPSSAFAFSSNGVGIKLPSTGSGSVAYINIQNDFVVFDSIQMQDPNSTSVSRLLQSTANLVISNCLFDGYAQDGGWDLIDVGGNNVGTTTIINTVVIDRSPASQVNTVVAISAYANLAISGLTMWGVNSPTTTIAIINQGTGGGFTNTIVDSIILGYPGGFTIGSNAGDLWTCSYLAISDTAITSSGVTVGAGMQYSKTATGEFVSASSSTPNLRLIGTASAINAGVTDTTINTTGEDILGTSRPQGTAWDLGAYEVPAAGAIGTAAGHATVSATSTTVYRSVGSASGHATVAGVSNSLAAVGTAAGHASVGGVSSSPTFAKGTANGQANVQAFNATGSLDAIIVINPIAPQPANTAFTISGTYTVLPALQYSDDATGVYNSIPISDISALGVQPFSFNHPGESAPGSYQVVITDTTTGVSGTATFTIVAGPPQRVAFTSSVFPPSGPPGLTTIIPSYLYQEYMDDDNLQALVQAQNEVAQGYLDWFNQINLPIYTQLSGPLLDWVAAGLYGMVRPNLTTSTSSAIGPFNTYPFDTLPMAAEFGTGTTTVFTITDDLFKRFITWNFYKGDGFTFNVPWLKRRIMRFLGGTNGVDYGVSETYQVSVKFVGKSTINITISQGSQPTTYVPTLAAAIGAGVCQLPFQYSYNILQS